MVTRAPEPPRAGVLALQGDFAAHAAALGGAREVRTAADVDACDVLVLPGGESTTLLRLLAGSGIEDAVRRLHARGGVLFGTCAGAILLARRVSNPAQPSWGLLDADVQRNAYGRQRESFEAVLTPPHPAVFIRAPRFTRLGPGVEVLARLGDDPVLVREGRVFAATYHPEMTDDRSVHRLVLAAAAARPAP
jgi:5'-phosphate synthase pdxT subunit